MALPLNRDANKSPSERFFRGRENTPALKKTGVVVPLIVWKVTYSVNVKEIFDGGTAMLIIEVMSFLKDLLNNHIMVSDKKYAPFLNSKGVV